MSSAKARSGCDELTIEAKLSQLDKLRCPACAAQNGGRLDRVAETWLLCQEPGCSRKYPIRDGLPVMLLDEGERWVDVKPEDLPFSALEDRPSVPDAAWLQRKAQELRITILQMVVRAGSGHIGGAYSIIGLVTAMYFRKSRLKEFLVDDGLLGGHPEMGRIPGVEVTTGSLGHGLPLANGMAMALKMDGRQERVFTILSDGECNEGTIWEGFLCSAQLGRDHLVVVIGLLTVEKQIDLY